MENASTGFLVCRLCGQSHHPVPLRRGERALCAQCGTVVARRPLSKDASLAFTLSALVLAIPAVQLPLVVARKFGAEHASFLWTGIRALWRGGMPLLAVWVTLCGVIVPLALLGTLVAVVGARFTPASPPSRFWSRAAHALEHWSMPEVQVLAVLVAFIKIGALVNVQPGPGLWFYSAMTLATLLAWRSAEMRDPSS